MSSRIVPIVIGMPVFNGARHLCSALDSVLSQTFDDFCLVIFDNGSSDSTEEICREYAAKDSRIDYRRFPVNRGGARNFSELVDAAKSPFFKWAAADDVIAPEMVQRCMERLFDEGPEVALVYPRTTLIDEDGREVGPYEDRLDLTQPRPSDRVNALLQNLRLCNAMFGVHRRDVLRATRRIAPFPASDQPMLVEIAMRGQIVEIPDRLFYRRFPKSVQGQTKRELQSWFDPSRRMPRVPVQWILRLEYEKAIWRSDCVPWSERARASRMHAASFVGGQYSKLPKSIQIAVRGIRRTASSARDLGREST